MITHNNSKKDFLKSIFSHFMQIFDIWTLVPSTSPERCRIDQFLPFWALLCPMTLPDGLYGAQRVAQDPWHTHSTRGKTSQGPLTPFQGQKVAVTAADSLGATHPGCHLAHDCDQRPVRGLESDPHPLYHLSTPAGTCRDSFTQVLEPIAPTDRASERDFAHFLTFSALLCPITLPDGL